MTYRQRPVYLDGRYFHRETSPSNPTSFTSAGSYELVAHDDVTSGGPVKDFRLKIATGRNATTDLVGSFHRHESMPASMKYGQKLKTALPATQRSYEIKGNMLAGFLGAASGNSVANTYVAVADNRARANFYQDLAETISSFKGMVFSGEIKESLSMVRNPARALRRGISDYLDHLKKNGPRKARRDRPKFVRETWLEYSFGWRPLVRDIDEAMRAFYASRVPRPIFRMVRGHGRMEGAPRFISSIDLSAGVGLRLRYNEQDSSSAEVKYYGVCHSRGNGPSTFAHYGFSPHEFVPTLWELVPYSFLVDYFTNIGDIISAWSYRNIGCSWSARGQKLVRLKEINNARVELTSSDREFTVNSGSPGWATAEYIQVARNASYGVPLPDFQAEVPGMGTKWVNMLALTSQLGNTRRTLAS